ncbi:hypothetical protein ACFW2E_23700, partial [Streptomyces sp. NPDC058964]
MPAAPGPVARGADGGLLERPADDAWWLPDASVKPRDEQAAAPDPESGAAVRVIARFGRLAETRAGWAPRAVASAASRRAPDAGAGA